VTDRLLEVSPDQLDDWDGRTVDPAGGHIFQSRAWGRHRARTGWHPHFLRFDDGFSVLALERRWPLLGGGSAYIPRGPIPADGSVERTARRLAAVAAWLGERGLDVVASDAEVPAGRGYEELLAGMGFHRIEEIQPSRHRLSLLLEAGMDEEGVLARVSKSTRQRIRQATDSGIRIVRHDARMAADPGRGFEAGARTGAEAASALATFYDLVTATGERRGFALGARSSYLAWWRAALEAGHVVHLEAHEPGHDGAVIAGLLLYRHGGRLSTAYSGDRADRRESHPAVFHLLRFRAIELALREGCREMDLGGVDVAGARHEPQPGDAMHGLYQHKRSFGAVWVELAGAHERVIRPGRYRAGRVASALVARTRRIARRASGNRAGRRQS
jgi:lipid II:glycine glycyltransferase (peptidoglycan interpeptide bridge formation enzyme)